MSFLGGPVEALESAIWEQKPDVPDLPRINLQDVQSQTARGNLAALPTLESIATGVNAFQRGERGKTLAGIPGLAELENLTLGNLGSWLRGQIPEDVSSAVASSAAGRALAGGYGGSGMARNLTARDLGLTSLDLSRMAVPLANQFAANEFNMRNVPMMDPTAMFLDPMQSAQFQANQNAAQWQRNWLNARVEAQPEPWQQSIMDSTQQGGAIFDKLFSQAAGSALSMVGGGMGGGMGGMMGGMMGGGGSIPVPSAGNTGSFGGQGGYNPPANQGWDYSPYGLGGGMYA